jgi:hypothetical protein
VLIGRRYSGREGKAKHAMMLLALLIVAGQANLIGTVARDWKYVSPCARSSEGFLMDHHEHIVAVPKKSGKCNLEEQLRKLVNAAVDSAESVWVKKWD